MCKDRWARGLLVLAVAVSLSLGLFGCGPALQELTGIKAQQADRLAPLSAQGTQCQLRELDGEERELALEQALADREVGLLRQELEMRGYTLEPGGAQALALGDQLRVILPAADGVRLIYVKSPRGSRALVAFQEGAKTVNLGSDGSRRVVFPLDKKKVQGVFKQLRQSQKFKALEKRLKKGLRRIDQESSLLILDRERGELLIALAIGEQGKSIAKKRIEFELYGYLIKAKLKRVEGEIELELSGIESIQNGCGEAPLHLQEAVAFWTGEGSEVSGASAEEAFLSEADGTIELLPEWGDIDPDKIEPKLCVWLDTLVCTGDLNSVVVSKEVSPSFGFPSDLYSYKLTFLKPVQQGTYMRLQLLSDCATGSWIAKERKYISSGTTIEWTDVDMSGYWDEGDAGETCKFRVYIEKDNKYLGPFNGPWMVTSEFLAIQILEGYNAAMDTADYGVVFARDHAQGESPIFLAGFEGLSLEEVRNLYSTVQNAVQNEVPDLSSADTTIKEAVELLLSIDRGMLRYWLLALVEADDQGTFDEAYAQLLTEGLQQLEQVFLIVGVTGVEVKELIRSIAQQYYELIKPLIPVAALEGGGEEENIDLQEALSLLLFFLNLFASLVESEEPIPFSFSYGDFSFTLTIPGEGQELSLEEFREFAIAWLGATLAVWEAQPDEVEDFIASVSQIISNGENGEEQAKRIKKLKELLHWGQGLGRTDQLIGTVYTLENAVRSGWEFKDVWISGDHAGVVVRKHGIPSEEAGKTYNISGLILGDQSSDPDIDQTIDWVDWALDQISYSPGWWSDLQLGGCPDIDIGAVVFTEPGTDGWAVADALSNQFGNDSRLAEVDRALFVVWVAMDGTVWYDCIGAACGEIPEDVEEQIACDLAGGCDEGVQEHNDEDSEEEAPQDPDEGASDQGAAPDQGDEGGISGNATTIGGPNPSWL